MHYWRYVITFLQVLIRISPHEIASVKTLVEEDMTWLFRKAIPAGVHEKYWDQRYRASEHNLT